MVAVLVMMMAMVMVVMAMAMVAMAMVVMVIMVTRIVMIMINKVVKKYLVRMLPLTFAYKEYAASIPNENIWLISHSTS